MAIEFKSGLPVKAPLKLSAATVGYREDTQFIGGVYKCAGPFISDGPAAHDIDKPFTDLHNPAVSKAQARLFGAIAGGTSTKAKGMTTSEAKEALKGQKLGGLPARK